MIGDTGDERRAHPLDYISRDQIQDLWGIGYTIVPRMRHPDPFYLTAEMVPHGRFYQWMHLVHDKNWIANGWASVPASRHEGLFMPFGTVGPIEVSGLGLFEKPKSEADADIARQTEAVHKRTQEWAARVAAGGFVGTATSIDGGRVEIGATKTIENITAIPKDMVPYMAHIFEERDRLGMLASEAFLTDNVNPEVAAAVDAYAKGTQEGNPQSWPRLNAILLPIAVENIRKKLKEADHAKDS